MQKSTRRPIKSTARSSAARRMHSLATSPARRSRISGAAEDAALLAECEKKLSASKLRVRMRAPFYATLMLYAKFVPDSSIPTCATDGYDIFYNPEFMNSLPPKQLDFCLLHEVLHAALRHPLRRLTRDPNLWNIAADVVVNGIAALQDYLEVWPHSIRRKDLEHLHAEEIYDLLEKEQAKRKQQQKKGGGKPGKGQKGQGQPQPGQGGGQPGGDPSDAAAQAQAEADKDHVQKSPCFHEGKEHKHDSPEQAAARRKAADAHWKKGVAQAEVVQRTTKPGQEPAGWGRLLDTIQGPQIDWRTELWRFLTPTPADWQGFDRRFVGRGLYIDQLEGETVNVYICVDTSGSINQKELTAFIGEIYGILRAYPHVTGHLFFADAALYGPYKIEPDMPLPKPEGGGGTSFRPFFEYMDKHVGMNDNAIAVYLTDGFGDFPSHTPQTETLWVVLPGGADDKVFPFGRVVRLVNHAGDTNLLRQRGRGKYFIRHKPGAEIASLADRRTRRSARVSGSTALAKTSAPAKSPVAKMAGLLVKSQSLQGKMSAVVKAAKKKSTPKKSTKKASSKAKKR